MMKTVRYYGIEDVRYEELAVPDVGADDVLIKVLYAGICGHMRIGSSYIQKGHVCTAYTGDHGA